MATTSQGCSPSRNTKLHTPRKVVSSTETLIEMCIFVGKEKATFPLQTPTLLRAYNRLQNVDSTYLFSRPLRSYFCVRDINKINITKQATQITIDHTPPVQEFHPIPHSGGDVCVINPVPITVLLSPASFGAFSVYHQYGPDNSDCCQYHNLTHLGARYVIGASKRNHQ